MGRFGDLLKRGTQSALVWSWVLNALRLGSGVLLLPLLLHRLSESELGLYYLFLTMASLLPVLDASLAVNVSRHVAYAMTGATSLQAFGVSKSADQSGPNFPLLRQLFAATKTLYRILAVGIAITLGCIGTLLALPYIHRADHPELALLAWGVTLLSCAAEIYSGWANVFLSGMNRVVLSARLGVGSYALRLVLASALLWEGLGLLSVPLATLVSSAFQRFFARRICARLLEHSKCAESHSAIKSLLKVVWPNTWRVLLKLASIYLSANAVAYICLHLLGLASFGQYALSVQIFTVIQSVSAVFTMVKWPLVAQLRQRKDHTELQRLLRQRLWFQNLTFLVLAFAAIAAGQPLLDWWHTGKRLLPVGWLSWLALLAFLEMEFAFWTHLLTTENRVPSLWPTVITYPLGVLLAFIFATFSPIGPGAFVLGPLLAGSLFNYWYWPIAGARSLQTNWVEFVFMPSSGGLSAK